MKAICLDQSENDQGSITVQWTLKSEACDNLVYIKCQLRSIVICLFVCKNERKMFRSVYCIRYLW